MNDLKNVTFLGNVENGTRKRLLNCVDVSVSEGKHV